MSYTYYSSADAGAPVLNGTAGSLITWFDTICVGSGTAYGSKPKKGWTKPYSGTHAGVFRTADGVGYYRVQHDGAHGAASTREAVVRGAEGATGINALVDPFPTVAVMADDRSVWKLSDTADSTAREWVAIVSPNLVILRVQHGSTQASTDVFLMGRYAEKRGSNAWAYLLNVRNAINTNTVGGVAWSCWVTSFTSTMSGSLFGMRTPNGLIKSPQMGLLGSVVNSNRVGATASPEAPDADGDVNILPALVVCNSSVAAASSGPVLAGVLPCVWDPIHGQYAVDITRDDTFTSTRYNASATLSLWSSSTRGTGHWRCVAEISDTWVSPYG